MSPFITVIAAANGRLWKNDEVDADEDLWVEQP